MLNTSCLCSLWLVCFAIYLLRCLLWWIHSTLARMTERIVWCQRQWTFLCAPTLAIPLPFPWTAPPNSTPASRSPSTVLCQPTRPPLTPSTQLCRSQWACPLLDLPRWLGFPPLRILVLEVRQPLGNQWSTHHTHLSRNDSTSVTFLSDSGRMICEPFLQ